MTLEEAIYKEEALAYSFGERWKRLGEPVGDLPELEAEHRQMADWLRELKEYKDERVGCEYCKHKFREQHERPCSLCQRNFMDMFESEVNADGK
ncbi:MAG TPA: hypothetical protein DHV37_05990 [Erysipelotrichaceae bacterium]|nr:hypothetical protein [Erysipelotrichaceae bacterium]